MHLFWGARAQRDLYLETLPEQWQKEHNNFRYTPVLSDPLAEDHWQGTTGNVHEAIVTEYPDLSAYEVYAGGPPLMVEAGANTFIDHQLYLANYFADSFEFAKD
jgi:CDP-4-dehydro-6-deoxyglucose reductase